MLIFPARIVNLDDCLSTGYVACECDLSRGYCGEDPKTCRKWDGNETEIKKGMEITLNCKCLFGLNIFKLCQEHSNYFVFQNFW